MEKEMDRKYTILFPHCLVKGKDELIRRICKYKQITLRINPYDSNYHLNEQYILMDRLDLLILYFSSTGDDKLMTQAETIDMEADRPQWQD